MSTELMTIEKLAPQAGVNWETAKRFVDAAARFEHGAVACRVMAGLVLVELKKELGVSRGTRTDLAQNFPHDAGSWSDVVKSRLEISEDTAGRWMKMAEAARPRLIEADVSGVFGQLLQLPVTQLSEAQAATLRGGVEQLVDGRSQLDFMESLGLLAPPPPKGGDKEWEAFLREKHPELIKNGKVPVRGKCGKDSKAILEEFSAWLEKRAKHPTKSQRIESAKALLSRIEDALTAGCTSDLLGLLPPEEFVGVAAQTRLFRSRVEELQSRKK